MIKHAKATELITNATGLTAEQIFNTIKAAVDLWNKDKTKSTIINVAAANITSPTDAQPTH